VRIGVEAVIDETCVGVSRASASAIPGIYASHDGLRALIREAITNAGFGRENSSAPLADIIEPGTVVLLKPNWVLHENRSGATMDCMVTHPAFVLAALAEVLVARPGRVLIADAPIQGADFDRLVTPAWRAQVQRLAEGTPVEILDLRNTVATHVGDLLTTCGGRRSASRFTLFDLGRDSLLEPVSQPAGCFRNTSYDPDDMARVQGPGVHKFLLCKEAFEADVILNLPKLKAHAKTGVTAALKNLVGLNGDKNYLPHHRLGGSALGGDCYEGLRPFKRLAEFLLDQANRRIGRRSYVLFKRAARYANAVHRGDLEGKWAGNDTAWRMVLDLNRIVLYGDVDGVMHESPQRKIYSLTDAIVAGDRNGPLAPEPVPLGVVTFASSSAHADAVHLALMAFDGESVPLVKEAFREMRWKLAANSPITRVGVAGRTQTVGQCAASIRLRFRPPDGWARLSRGLPEVKGDECLKGEAEAR
jgi:uncharacterized protein (DUF362 family)